MVWVPTRNQIPIDSISDIPVGVSIPSCLFSFSAEFIIQCLFALWFINATNCFLWESWSFADMQGIHVLELMTSSQPSVSNCHCWLSTICSLNGSLCCLKQYPGAVYYPKRSFWAGFTTLNGSLCCLKQYPRAVYYPKWSFYYPKRSFYYLKRSFWAGFTTLNGSLCRLKQYPRAVYYLKRSFWDGFTTLNGSLCCLKQYPGAVYYLKRIFMPP